MTSDQKIKERRVASKSQTNKQTDRHRKRGGGGGAEGVGKRQQSSGKQRRHRGRRHHVNFCLDEANVARVAVVPLVVLLVVVAVSLCIHILCTLSLSLSPVINGSALIKLSRTRLELTVSTHIFVIKLAAWQIDSLVKVTLI